MKPGKNILGINAVNIPPFCFSTLSVQIICKNATMNAHSGFQLSLCHVVYLLVFISTSIIHIILSYPDISSDQW